MFCAWDFRIWATLKRWMDHPSKIAVGLITLRPTQKASIIAVMTATCIASNYAMIGIANVKLMDLLVFVTGLAFGHVTGMTVGVLTWLIYGILNPYGFSLPVLIATISMEALYGLAGGMLSRYSKETVAEASIASSLKYAIMGFILTFIYDVGTSIAFAVSVGMDVGVALVSGIPFAVVHEGSNAVLFFLGVVPAVKGINRVFNGG